ncbi:ABC transporter permease [Spongisporangium articulatum]|uniref:ABC transporter permease n=1 Tax=Spongisporangium articulatum TaxID=3362603 RepID=A0ABW8AHJ3_9ACTN
MTLLRRVLTPVAFGALVLLVWQLAVDLQDIPGYLLPSPTAIWEQVHENASDILDVTVASGLNALIGLLVGIVLAVVVAVLAVWVPVLQRLLTPLASGVAAMPIVALAPVLFIMFAADSDLPRRIVVTVVAFFPVFVTTVRGLTRIEPVHAELLRSYAASAWETTRVVRLPGAVPYLFTGVRVASSLAVISAVVAEYFGGLQNGLGSRITSAASNTAYARAWAYVVAAIGLGLVFYVVSLGAERLATRGRAVEQA